MLTIDSGIFDPARRPAAIAEAFAAVGMDPEDEAIAPLLAQVNDGLDALFPDAPETTAEMLDVLGVYVGILIANLYAGRNIVEPMIADLDARLTALEP